MMGLLKNILTGTLILATMIVLGTCSVKCANAGEFSVNQEVSVGYKDMVAGHSEGKGADQRCMNGGFGVDLEYRLPLSYDLNKWLGVSVVPGAMTTYSNFETAFRVTSTSPESKQKQESSFRETLTLRPTIRIWKVRLFKVYGLGLDYNEPTRSFGLGYIRPDDSRGIGVDFTENFSVNAEEYKFIRYDGTTYRYQTVNLNWTF
jgi:hypothetical protein